jgi:hypothetical protein
LLDGVCDVFRKPRRNSIADLAVLRDSRSGEREAGRERL